MIEVQRQLKKESKNYRAFEILNIGKYEREYYVNHASKDLREEEKGSSVQRKKRIRQSYPSATKRSQLNRLMFC